MHAQVSGTIDYRDPNDEACLARLRRLVGAAPPDPPRLRRAFTAWRRSTPARPGDGPVRPGQPRSARRIRSARRARLPRRRRQLSTNTSRSTGRSLVCGTARLGGFAIGVVANQHHRVKPAEGPIQFGGVLYVDSAEKAARFVMNCNQDWLPIVFLQDVNGFMVGRDSERAGIIKAGAKLVSAISNSRVPKLTVIVGGSFGAGNYALCGKAFDPRLIFAWPNARCAVMGARAGHFHFAGHHHQEPGTQRRSDRRRTKGALRDASEGGLRTPDGRALCRGATVGSTRSSTPAETRDDLIQSLEVVTRHADAEPYRLGVFQV